MWAGAVSVAMPAFPVVKVRIHGARLMSWLCPAKVSSGNEGFVARPVTDKSLSPDSITSCSTSRTPALESNSTESCRSWSGSGLANQEEKGDRVAILISASKWLSMNSSPSRSSRPFPEMTAWMESSCSVLRCQSSGVTVPVVRNEMGMAGWFWSCSAAGR